MLELRRLASARYVTPLREGGSLPGLVETDDGLFVLKMRGAGQGTRALVAEIVAGELARALGFRVPELALVSLDAALAATERDQELQDLLRASVGVNVGLRYLPGAVMFDPAADRAVPDALASRLVGFDAYVMNVDRAARNPNLLWCEGELWLIDHGAALLWHHSWDGSLAGSDRRFPYSRDHVLLPWAESLSRRPAALAAELVSELGDALIADVVGAVPDEWIGERRAAYVAYLRARRDAAAAWIEEAAGARAQRV